MTTWNHVVLGDGTRAVLVPGGACINRIIEADGHRSCEHGDHVPCDRTGHQTISLYEVIREGDPGYFAPSAAAGVSLGPSAAKKVIDAARALGFCNEQFTRSYGDFMDSPVTAKNELTVSAWSKAKEAGTEFLDALIEYDAAALGDTPPQKGDEWLDNVRTWASGPQGISLPTDTLTLVAEVERLRAALTEEQEVNASWATRYRVVLAQREEARAAIEDIDAHATPLGEDDDGFVAVGYAVSVGSLHRALGIARQGMPAAFGDTPQPRAEVDTRRLEENTTADVWAEEFAKVRPDVDEGLMLGWFANAIEAGKRAGFDSGVAFASSQVGLGDTPEPREETK